MKKAFGDYKHLSGKTLWEGPDHLLFIEESSFFFTFSEQYRRIDFKNIQAITLTTTTRYSWVAFWLTLLLGLVVWISLSNATLDFTEPGIWVALTICGVLLTLLIVHLAKGKTARMQLQTAVQVLRLKSVRRMKQGHDVLARLTELCLLHQGGIMPQTGEMQQVQDDKGSAAAAAARQMRRMPGSKPLFSGSKWVTAGMALLLLTGLSFIAEPFVPSLVLLYAEMLLVLLTGIALIITLATAIRYRTPGLIYAASWVGLAIMAAWVVGVYFALVIASSVFKPLSMMDQIRRMAEKGMGDLGNLGWVYAGAGLVCVLMGLLGLPAALRPPAEPLAEATPPPLPTAVPAAEVEPGAAPSPEPVTPAAEESTPLPRDGGEA
jgi:hypothetical protein